VTDQSNWVIILTDGFPNSTTTFIGPKVAYDALGRSDAMDVCRLDGPLAQKLMQLHRMPRSI
jgi:hypothetical protein